MFFVVCCRCRLLYFNGKYTYNNNTNKQNAYFFCTFFHFSAIGPYWRMKNGPRFMSDEKRKKGRFCEISSEVLASECQLKN